jgi:hypothetical protein
VSHVGILAAGLLYFVLAQTAFMVIGRPAVLGMSADVAHALLIALAVTVFILLAVHTARKPGPRWLRHTVVASALAAMLGALAHTVSLGVQVRWGERCNQCTPVLFMIELTLLAGILAVVGAVPVGIIARRFSAQRPTSVAGSSDGAQPAVAEVDAE